MLIRPPRGYAVNHPALDWLRYTSFTAGRELSAEDVTSSRLSGLLTRHYAALVPLVRWLNGALGLPEATQR